MITRVHIIARHFVPFFLQTMVSRKQPREMKRKQCTPLTKTYKDDINSGVPPADLDPVREETGLSL